MNKTNIATMFGATDVSTFLGLPSCPSPDQVNAKAAILGVPCATPYASVGPYCANGPDAIRAAAAPYAANLEHMDFDFSAPLLPGGPQDACDLGDLDFSEDSASNRAAIKAAVSAIVERGAVPMVLGGDDSIPIPMLQAFEGRDKYTIVQIDAHIDWRDEVDGERWGLSSTMRRASEMDHIERIIQVGARNIGSARPQDYADALAWGVKFFTARDIASGGMTQVADAIPNGSNVIICFDCDGLDPAIMPGVIGRAPGGLGYWQTIELLNAISAKARISAFDLVEFMPDCDVDGLGALTAYRMVAATLGLVCRQ
ncbi:arginase family protein [Anderseniella sp. Alg231-50]|uniref:arginase family protein n=1 Tax=Anderseniella sp. Alg231-50 TaxID=1922226 RepID=UPI000D54C4BC